MSLLIDFRLEAQAEFDEAFDWYEEQQPGLGVNFVNIVTNILEQISFMPQSCTIVFKDVRRAVVPKFPYSILYKIEANNIVVIAVFHSKRNPKIWQQRA
jgi:plasmid stabilization system protein ParE